MPDIFAPERMKNDCLINPIEKFGQEPRPQGLTNRFPHFLVTATLLGKFLNHLAPHVRGHDDQGVCEIDRASLIVGKPAIIEHLQQNIEHVAVRFFDFIQEDNTVRTPTNRLRQRTSLFIADVARRCTDESTHSVPFHIFAHIETNHRRVIIKEDFGKCLTEFGLTHPGRPEEQKRADRSIGVLQSTSTPPYGVRNRLDSFILSHHALVESILHDKQLCAFGFHHPSDRNPGPASNNPGYFILRNLLTQKPFIG